MEGAGAAGSSMRAFHALRASWPSGVAQAPMCPSGSQVGVHVTKTMLGSAREATRWAGSGEEQGGQCQGVEAGGGTIPKQQGWKQREQEEQ